MKQIKFTEENLKRHLNAFPYKGETHRAFVGSRIHTMRDEQKGEIGDVFFIEGLGKFVLTAVFPYGPEEFEYMIRSAWYQEGFVTESEFRNEICRIYGEEPKTYYSHNLLKLNEDD